LPRIDDADVKRSGPKKARLHDEKESNACGGSQRLATRQPHHTTARPRGNVICTSSYITTPFFVAAANLKG